MKSNKIYRVLVLGPTGVGKSQFCNFVQKDINNSINQVDDSIISCTKEPKSNKFERGGITYEFIDTAGAGDDKEIDEINFIKLVDYIKSAKQIDYILFLLSFRERLKRDSKEYIRQLGNIFTPTEFYDHVSIIFTNTPDNPSKKETEKVEKNKKDIREFFENTFDVKNSLKSKEIDVYFLDTEIDENTNTFNIKSQKTMDIILEQLKLYADIYPPINTSDIDESGNNVKLKMEKEQSIIKLIKNETEKKNLKNEDKKVEKGLINKLDNMKDLGIIKEEAEEKKLSQEITQKEEQQQLITGIKKKNEHFIKRQKIINNKISEEGIRVEHINIEQSSNSAFIATSIVGGLVTVGGLLLVNVLPFHL